MSDKHKTYIGLPKDFSFPDKYLEEISMESIPSYGDWYYLIESEGLQKQFYDIAQEDYPSRSLVPFARYDGTDDVACFEGGDATGNPEVYIIHFFSSSGWEQRAKLSDFENWLSLAKSEVR